MNMAGLHQEKYYEPLEAGRVLCRLCPHDCRITEGGRGACGVRYNHAGKIYTLVYDKVVASNVEPLEKKTTVSFLTWQHCSELLPSARKQDYVMCIKETSLAQVERMPLVINVARDLSIVTVAICVPIILTKASARNAARSSRASASAHEVWLAIKPGASNGRIVSNVKIFATQC